MTTAAGWLIAAAGLLAIAWMARGLDRYEARLADERWDEYTLEEIRALPETDEVAA